MRSNVSWEKRERMMRHIGNIIPDGSASEKKPVAHRWLPSSETLIPTLPHLKVSYTCQACNSIHSSVTEILFKGGNLHAFMGLYILVCYWIIYGCFFGIWIWNKTLTSCEWEIDMVDIDGARVKCIWYGSCESHELMYDLQACHMASKADISVLIPHPIWNVHPLLPSFPCLFHILHYVTDAGIEIVGDMYTTAGGICVDFRLNTDDVVFNVKWARKCTSIARMTIALTWL